MTTRSSLLGVAAALLAFNTHAAGENCSQPDAPDIPDGSKATESEMLDAQQAVKGYVQEGQQYLKCLKQAEADIGEDITKEQQKELVGRYNTMVDEMQESSDAFNAAVRDYQAAAQ